MDKLPLTDDLFPEIYLPDWDALQIATKEEPFTEAAFYLLRECAQTCTILAVTQSDIPLTRNKAIDMGLAVRLSKLGKAIVRDLSNQECFQQLSLSRQILETSANLVYLINDDGSGSRYDEYVMDSLVAERETLKVVQANVKERGGEIWHIEKRMRASIEKTASDAGIDNVEDLPGRKKIGFPSIEDRIQLLGATTYVGYRTGSAEVHGTWTDLIKYHLTYDGTSFAPNLENPNPRPHVATTTTSVLARVFQAFLDSVDIKELDDRFEPLFVDLIARNDKLVAVHEEWLEKQDKKAKDSEQKSQLKP